MIMNSRLTKTIGTQSLWMLLVSAIFALGQLSMSVEALYDFPVFDQDVPANEKQYLDLITDEDYRQFIKYGEEAINREISLENNLYNSDVTVQNGSLSHDQLLETLPTAEAKSDCLVARKILRSSQYAYSTKCAPRNVNGDNCRNYLSQKPLPLDTELRAQCENIINQPRESHIPLRRLLPNNYQDGFYTMPSENVLPPPRLVSSSMCQGHQGQVLEGDEALDEGQRNLALVQWAQFIEHDLSKPVVTSMQNGQAIECCNWESYKLQPRYLHPACAPLLGKDSSNKYGRETCLNYVRSALAVDWSCNFGAAEQLNQASGYLDLSQLYGCNSATLKSMRSFRGGLIQSTPYADNADMLPLASGNDALAFCSLKPQENTTACYKAGDSRVNSNPFSIVLYTIFMRSHNQIARKLEKLHGDWNDEQLYNKAKSINVRIYRNIVFNEWLPALLGKRVAMKINMQAHQTTASSPAKHPQISNEFAVAAMRFYFSMMPNVLQDISLPVSPSHNNAEYEVINNDVAPAPTIFTFHNQSYDSATVADPAALNNVLKSLLHQQAMKMDSTYAQSFIQSYMGTKLPTRSDVFAFDIQRGRDHGLQPYVKYLEICQNTKISSWDDLLKYIEADDLLKLKNIYQQWADIDLIVGGVSEKPVSGSAVGPTFSCILGEQLSRMRAWPGMLQDETTNLDAEPYKAWTAAKLLCSNSQLEAVPKNIFKIDSEHNPLMSCATL